VDHPLSLAPLDVPGLLRRYHLQPDKRLGQNFLIDTSALQRIVNIAEVSTADQVLEIGPGLGSLTCYLASLAKHVVAIELDGDLILPLQEVLSHFDNVHIIQGDILAVDIGSILSKPGYLVVANIPYYITSALIRILLEAKLPPSRLVLTVQREVAERICAEPGDMSLLALSVQVYGQPRIMTYIPAGAFYPPPKVDSAVVRVDIFPVPLIPSNQLDTFFRLAKAGFSQKRKTLRNALAGGMGWLPTRADSLLHTAGIDPKRRAETLSLDEWKSLVETSNIHI
jgi:16S rRNA (adenine1518-N6/adenine1519-N6)-dimethyltransferase